LRLKEGVHSWIKSSLNDPIAQILLENSQLTKVQLETFLIDILAENIARKPLKYDEKSRLRLLKDGVSRGAFNRTLRQARRNVVRSIYTILLLGYLGVFEETTLDPYVEVANRLQAYVNTYRNVWEKKELMNEQIRIISMLRSELETSLERLSSPRAISKKRDITGHNITDAEKMSRSSQ